MKTTPCYLVCGSFNQELTRTDAAQIILEHRRMASRLRAMGQPPRRMIRQVIPGWFSLGALNLHTR